MALFGTFWQGMAPGTIWHLSARFGAVCHAFFGDKGAKPPGPALGVFQRT
jgi:hypothetical protein